MDSIQQTMSHNSDRYPSQATITEQQSSVRWYDRVLNGLLAPNLAAGLIRFLVLVVGPVLILFFLSWIKLPLLTKENWPVLILFILPFLITFEGASIYIQSLYGLESLGLARKVLLATAFGLAPGILWIRNGANTLEEQTIMKQNRMVRVGGPGLVRISSENAVLFEKPDGKPYVLGPTTKPLFHIKSFDFVPIQGFDRIRQVVDLPDHVMEWEVKARTRDGIVIKATNLQIVFSIRRKPAAKLPGQTTSYPFSRQAILHLVYQQYLIPGAFAEVIRPLIRNQFRAFIENSTLKELLTSIQNFDIRGINSLLLDRHVPRPLPRQTPRPQISGSFTDITNKFSHDTFVAGVQLEWINVGVWQFDADRIIQQHVDAWRTEFDSRNMTAPVPTARLQQDALAEEMKFQLHEVSLKFANLMKENRPRDEIIYKMLAYLYGKIRIIRNNFSVSDSPKTDEELNKRTVRNIFLQSESTEIDQALNILKEYLDSKAVNSGVTFIGPTNAK